MVKAVKHTEKMMEARVSLNYQERMLLLKQAVRIVNNHPLEACFRKGNELSLSNVRDAIFACLKTLQVLAVLPEWSYFYFLVIIMTFFKK